MEFIDNYNFNPTAPATTEPPDPTSQDCINYIEYIFTLRSGLYVRGFTHINNPDNVDLVEQINANPKVFAGRDIESIDRTKKELEGEKEELEKQLKKAQLKPTITTLKNEKDVNIVELNNIKAFNTSLANVLQSYFGKNIVSKPTTYSKAAGHLQGVLITIKSMRNRYEPCAKAYKSLLGTVAQNSGLSDALVNKFIKTYTSLQKEHQEAIKKIKRTLALYGTSHDKIVLSELDISTKTMNEYSFSLVKELFPKKEASLGLLSTEWKGRPVLLLQENDATTFNTIFKTIYTISDNLQTNVKPPEGFFAIKPYDVGTMIDDSLTSRSVLNGAVMTNLAALTSIVSKTLFPTRPQTGSEEGGMTGSDAGMTSSGDAEMIDLESFKPEDVDAVVKRYNSLSPENQTRQLNKWQKTFEEIMEDEDVKTYIEKLLLDMKRKAEGQPEPPGAKRVKKGKAKPPRGSSGVERHKSGTGELEVAKDDKDDTGEQKVATLEDIGDQKRVAYELLYYLNNATISDYIGTDEKNTITGYLSAFRESKMQIKVANEYFLELILKKEPRLPKDMERKRVYYDKSRSEFIQQLIKLGLSDFETYEPEYYKNYLDERYPFYEQIPVPVFERWESTLKEVIKVGMGLPAIQYAFFYLVESFEVVFSKKIVFDNEEDKEKSAKYFQPLKTMKQDIQKANEFKGFLDDVSTAAGYAYMAMSLLWAFEPQIRTKESGSRAIYNDFSRSAYKDLSRAEEFEAIDLINKAGFDFIDRNTRASVESRIPDVQIRPESAPGQSFTRHPGSLIVSKVSEEKARESTIGDPRPPIDSQVKKTVPISGKKEDARAMSVQTTGKPRSFATTDDTKTKVEDETDEMTGLGLI
jgi:hypothetical protein